MPTGTTADYTLTRDQLIEMAYETIGILEPGQVMDSEMLEVGISRLALIMRETDKAGRWRWTIQAATHLPLAANTAIYSSANGLATNIAELLSVTYRNEAGRDSAPLRIIKAESYEEITDKTKGGDPLAVYLTDHQTLASRTLYVWQTLGTIATQSVVTGTDALAYRCILPHTAAAVNRPITGANWSMFWELGGSGAVAWASGASYTSPNLLRMLYRRPLYDFDTAADTPDTPLEWSRVLLYKLAFELGDVYRIPEATLQRMIGKAQGAYDDIFQHGVTAKSNTRHHKAKYF